MGFDEACAAALEAAKTARLELVNKGTMKLHDATKSEEYMRKVSTQARLAHS